MNAPGAKVSLVRCAAYERESLHPSLLGAVDLLGGIRQFVRPQQKVFVKVNHLPPPSPAERGIVTHPFFVEQVLAMLLEAGAQVRVGDDIHGGQEDGFAISGLRQVCRRMGVDLVNLRQEGFRPVFIPQGEVLSQTYMARAVMEAEVIVNLPKFKTHSLTVFTGAIKNIYGCLPEGLRIRYHREFQGEKFHALLVDLFSVIRPQLHIMDAIVGMEGDGPAHGQTRSIGLVMASSDAVALDRVALAVAGIDPDDVLYVKKASARGFAHGRIHVLGEKIDTVRIPDFRTNAVPLHFIRKWVPEALFRTICRQLESRPQVISAKCHGCRVCEKVCPKGAIKVYHGVAGISRLECIACMCCHEACRFEAIRSRKGPVGRVLMAGLLQLRRYLSSQPSSTK
ncbi:MAG: DUF362 domain-containing protein [bacterium]